MLGLGCVEANFAVPLTQQQFQNQLYAMGIPLAQMQSQSQLSRYQLTRLLNAVECQDCVAPDKVIRQQYSIDFWKEFVQLPGKDFRDIGFEAAPFQNEDYYYCVAYVGDKSYMRGYPLQTSPLCSGVFCGQRNVSKAEFYQTLVNLLAERVASRYEISRTEVKKWLKKYDTSDYEYRVFDKEEISLIEKAPNAMKTLANKQEFNIYLKYCMFNPQVCGFTTFENIPKGVWPISQVNILIKEGVITPADTTQISSFISPKTALEHLYYVYSLHTQCSFDDDYDCDGIKNHQDNCQYDYNPSQVDMDADGIGDVCDDDIDGDGQTNPKGLIDETGNINYAVLQNQKSRDSTPLGKQDQDFYAFLHVDSIGKVPPYEVKMHIQSNQKFKTVERDFGDGEMGKGQEISHRYVYPGSYTLRAQFVTANGETKLISNQIYIGDTEVTQYGLELQNLKIIDNRVEVQAQAF